MFCSWKLKTLMDWSRRPARVYTTDDITDMRSKDLGVEIRRGITIQSSDHGKDETQPYVELIQMSVVQRSREFLQEMQMSCYYRESSSQ